MFGSIFQKVGSKGCFRFLFCKVSPEKFTDLVLYADHFVAENIQVHIQLINLNILLAWTSLTLICSINDKKLFGYIHDIVHSVAEYDSATNFQKNDKSPWMDNFFVYSKTR